MKNTGVRNFLIVAASLLTCLAVGLFYIAGQLSPLSLSAANYVAVGLIALGFILFALKLPLKLTRNTMPTEPKRILKLAGFGFLILGISLLVALAASPFFPFRFVWSAQWGLALFAVVLVCIALLGQAPFALSAPANFKMGELFSVLSSSGFNSPDSIANSEMKYWTDDEAAGIAVNTLLVDAPLHNLDLSMTSLAEVCRGEGITVLNFGSYTCPHHRRRIDQLRQLKDKYADANISFVTVYTAEAHPNDGWVIPGNFSEDSEYTGNEDDFCILQAKTIEARRDVAQRFIDNKRFNWPVFLDTMENTALRAYNSWPIRLYLVESGKIIYCGDQGPFGYQPDELEKALLAAMPGLD
jgi:type I thyroxine 5'-deiodinase